MRHACRADKPEGSRGQADLESQRNGEFVAVEFSWATLLAGGTQGHEGAIHRLAPSAGNAVELRLSAACVWGMHRHRSPKCKSLSRTSRCCYRL